jgi:hypothetical protein
LLAGWTLMGVAFLLFVVALLLGGVAALLAGWSLVGVPFLLLGVAALLGSVAALLAGWTLLGIAFLLIGIAALLAGVALLYRPDPPDDGGVADQINSLDFAPDRRIDPS